MRFEDRHAAGQVLSGELTRYENREDVIVLGLPRGGVPVACEVAKTSNAPLDVFLFRKLGVPGHSIIAAVPVGAPQACRDLAEVVDELACAIMPEQFFGVAQRYNDFSQTSDDEVKELLALALSSGPRR